MRKKIVAAAVSPALMIPEVMAMVASVLAVFASARA